MLHSWKIGDVKVSSIVEYCGPTHDPTYLYPAFDRAKFDAIRPKFPPGHYYPASDRLNIACQIWFLEYGGNVIMIDAGVGNAKPRRVERANMLNTLYPSWLAALGIARDKVTHVLMTHLHADHIGWCTVLDNGKWVPTFPKARYVMPKIDFDYFGAQVGTKAPLDDGSFGDSIQPVVDAGLTELITPDQREVLGLRITPAPGHTPGMLNYWLESRGETGVFSADVFHHPTQIYYPDWNTAFCVLPDKSKKTRHTFAAEAARTGALVMPCHFPQPHTGYVRREGDGYAYEPAKSGYGQFVD